MLQSSQLVTVSCVIPTEQHWQDQTIVESAARLDVVGLRCRGVLGSGDVTHFQYDVAEVKLSVRERPEWLESLTSSGQPTVQLCFCDAIDSIQEDHSCYDDVSAFAQGQRSGNRPALPTYITAAVDMVNGALPCC